MIKITAKNQEEFKTIEGALTTIDPLSIFLKDFEFACRDPETEGKAELLIKLEYSKKLEKNLNEQRYILKIPESLIIDEINIGTYSEVLPSSNRQTLYKVELICSNSEVEPKFKIIYKGLINPVISITRVP